MKIIAYLDEHGRIVIVGFDSWNNAIFIDDNRAIPDKWKKLIPAEDTYCDREGQNPENQDDGGPA